MKRSEVRVGMKVYASDSQRHAHPERLLEIVSEPWVVPGSLEGAVHVRRPGTDYGGMMFVHPLIAVEEK